MDLAQNCGPDTVLTVYSSFYVLTCPTSLIRRCEVRPGLSLINEGYIRNRNYLRHALTNCIFTTDLRERVIEKMRDSRRQQPCHKPARGPSMTDDTIGDTEDFIQVERRQLSPFLAISDVKLVTCF